MVCSPTGISETPEDVHQNLPASSKELLDVTRMSINLACPLTRISETHKDVHQILLASSKKLLDVAMMSTKFGVPADKNQ